MNFEISNMAAYVLPNILLMIVWNYQNIWTNFDFDNILWVWWWRLSFVMCEMPFWIHSSYGNPMVWHRIIIIGTNPVCKISWLPKLLAEGGLPDFSTWESAGLPCFIPVCTSIYGTDAHRFWRTTCTRLFFPLNLHTGSELYAVGVWYAHKHLLFVYRLITNWHA